MTPNPVEHARVDDPDSVARLRRLACRNYDACLTAAGRARWPGFACTSCAVREEAQPLIPLRLAALHEIDAQRAPLEHRGGIERRARVAALRRALRQGVGVVSGGVTAPDTR